MTEKKSAVKKAKKPRPQEKCFAIEIRVRKGGRKRLVSTETSSGIE